MINNKVSVKLDKIDLEENYDNSKSRPKKTSTYLIICLALAAIGGSFQFGWALGVYNIPANVLKAFYATTICSGRICPDNLLTTVDDLWTLTNGLFPLGGILGGLSSGFVADYFGRRNAIFYTNGFVLLTSLFNIISKFIPSYETLMVGRFLTGVFAGLFSGIVPMYLTEIPPIHLRGLAGTLSQLTVVTGILLSNIFGLKQIFGTFDLWPILAGFFLLPVIPNVCLFFFGVESPKFLFINRNNKEASKRALLRLRNYDEDQVEQELNEFEEEKQRLSQLAKVKWLDFVYVKALRRPLIVAIVLQCTQQFSGINAVIFYSTQIFIDAGLDGDLPVYATIAIGVVQLIMTLVCTAVVDRAGRKILLLIGIIGMCVSSFLLVAFRVLGKSYGGAFNYLTVVAAVLYIISFSIGPGAIPWLITAELFKSDARGKATSIAVFANWGSNTIVTFLYPVIEKAIGDYSFVIFGVLLILFGIFLVIFVPETKNKSTESIYETFERQVFFIGYN